MRGCDNLLLDSFDQESVTIDLNFEEDSYQDVEFNPPIFKEIDTGIIVTELAGPEHMNRLVTFYIKDSPNADISDYLDIEFHELNESDDINLSKVRFSMSESCI